MIFNLSRPKSMLPSSYFWTWDQSTNWVLDDPGIVNFGSWNKYLKKPETYVEDYRQLTDMALSLDIKGIVIWGFLRDSHGGIEYAKKVASYAKSKGVSIMPGVGTTHYGGVYHQGDNKYNINTFLNANPECGAVVSKEPGAKRALHAVCPSNPLFKEWISEGVNWLFREFDIGGCNFENGDFFSCYCDKCQAQKENWPKSDPNFFRYQAMCYQSALDTAKSIFENNNDLLITWATYCGFIPEKLAVEKDKPESFVTKMGTSRPEMFNRLSYEGIAQWTLTRMVREKEISLMDFLDNGTPDTIYDNPSWLKGITPPSKRSTGFVHQGSQWDYSPWESKSTRYSLILGRIKEACLRAYESGLEGVSIHGELTSRHIPAALNYLAFSHFTHWPYDTLRKFGEITLGEVFNNPCEGEDYVEILALWEAGKVDDQLKRKIKERYDSAYSIIYPASEDASESKLTKFFFWNWLYRLVSGFHGIEESFI